MPVGEKVLAFAPLKLATFLTAAVEHLYTQQTLSANSVVVWRACALAELRFGLRPGQFWLHEFSTLADDETVRGLLQDYYRGLTPDAFLKRKTFGEVTSALALERLRAREGNPTPQKASKPPPRFETIPYARRCHSCEHRNAVIEAPLGTWLCEPCARKRAFGQKAKKEVTAALQWFDDGGFNWKPLAAKAWGTRFEEWLQSSESLELSQDYYQHVERHRVYPADDLEDIAAAARPEGFIGVIYADGNNMGALLEELATPTNYQAFAEAIYKTTMQATFTALATHLRPHRHEGRWRHPFEVLSIGGDDVFLIVPAHAALPIAMTIATCTETRLREDHSVPTAQGYTWQQVHRITPPADRQVPAVQSRVALSSGVVIADQHTPVFLLRRMVEELLQSAKAKARQLREAGYYGATLDFIALKSFGMLATNVRAFRDNVLRQGALHLTAKPYTEPELSALIAAVKTLKQVAFPKSQLYRLREQLTKGRLASTMDYLYLQARSQQAEQLRSVLSARWSGYEPQGHTASTGVWMRRDTPSGELEWETVLGDVAELYDFVPAGGETYGA
jgi:CRISPR-associated protein Cmr2